MRRLLVMAVPLMGAQLLGMGNGLVDALVAGRLGPAELAAVGIGGSVIFLVTVTSIGLMAALSPLMAAERGAGRRTEVGALFRQGLWMALVFGLADLALVHAAAVTAPRWGLDADLVPPLATYLHAAKWSLPGAVLLLAARNVCEATGRTRQVLLVQGVALVVNLVANLGLGLGMFGLPRLGVAGIGWSTTIVQWTAAVTIFALLRRPTFARFRLWERFAWPDRARLAVVLSLSAPICLTLLSESALFGATAIGMGRLGTLPASAHNIAIGTAAFAYMLPVGLSFALAARVGAALGRGSMPSVRLRVTGGIALALAMATATSSLLAVFRHEIAALYTGDPEVRALAARFLVYAAVFQVSDAMQATLIAALRGAARHARADADQPRRVLGHRRADGLRGRLPDAAGARGAVARADRGADRVGGAAGAQAALAPGARRGGRLTGRPEDRSRGASSGARGDSCVPGAPGVCYPLGTGGGVVRAPHHPSETMPP